MAIIDKIEMVTNNNLKLVIDSSQIMNFFQMSKINPRTPFKTLFLRDLNKLSLLSLLIKASIRKILRLVPAVLEKDLISLIINNFKFKKINSLTIHIDGKSILFDIKDIHLLNLLSDLRGVVLNNQYKINRENVKNNVIIDAGSNNGEFSLFAALLGAKKVYAFEPVPSTASILEKNIIINKMQKKIIVVRKALGDRNYIDNMSFDYIGDGAARIGPIRGKKSERVEVVTLDDFAKKNKISNIGFIKMDVEGFEENVLKGARSIIKNNKPVLSFSAYHKPTDKKVLPAIVKSIRQDYNIRLNKLDEEDFYCD